MENPSEFILGENLLKSPPNFEMAKNHNVSRIYYLKRAQIIHNGIINNLDRCLCCSLPIQTTKYSILTDINVFSEYGTSYKYLKLLKTYFILLSIFFIIAGLYNLIQNTKGDLCIKSQSCKMNLNNQSSLLNRLDPEQYCIVIIPSYQDDVLDVLYAIAIIAQLVFVRYLTYQTNDYYNVDHDYDSEKTIKSCSFQISSINLKWKKNDILNYFRNGMLDEIPVQYNIIDCCLIYDINYLENELKLQVINVQQTENNGRSLKDIIRKTVNQFYVMNNSNKYLKFTGSVYITLSDEQEAKNFKKCFKRNFSLKECPRPSDVIWKKKISNGNPNLQLIKTAIACCGWLPNIAIEVAKNDYILSNPGKSQDQLQINTLLSLATALILFLSTKICIYTIENYVHQSSHDSKRQFWKQYLQLNEFLICIMFYLYPPIFVAVYSGEGSRQEKLWRAGGLSEDIILIILVNGVVQILFTIMDIRQAWKLIQFIYYKYFNQESNLTQFEANKLLSKKFNFHQKRVDLTILVFQCSYYGYLYPICYPITLISILIIYWLNKYQFINYGTNEQVQFKYRLPKLLIMMLVLSQLGSTQIIKVTFLGYTSGWTFSYIFYAQCIILMYIFLKQPEWLFKKRTSTIKTNLDLQGSLQNNQLYYKYNPVVNENYQSILFSENQQSSLLITQLLLAKQSRQQKYYNALQIKLLREIEQIQKKDMPRNQIRPNLEDVN